MGKSFRIDESSIYGRNDDKEAIIERLLSTDDQANSNGNLQVISIVGIGGIGKTFLTKLVYSDARVQEWFDVKIWICAATKFDLLKLAKDILEEVTCDTSISAHDDHILLELKEKLIGKKFLLILDDVWNDNRVEWSFLLSYLECGAQGSKIIVTTRNRSVALALGAAQSYFLSELGDDHCWNLFAKHAFSDEQCCSDPNHRVIEIIGKEIVRKCHGLPFIAIMLGDLLCSVKNVEEWEKLSKHMDTCTNYNIFMILKLSHVDLQFHLKQCLAYSIKSPKDYEFVKKKLILSWIEEGLVQPKENKEEEELGDCRYFHDLEPRDFVISISQNLFQWSIIGRDIEVIFEWGITITNLILEILLVIFDQIASPEKPHYALIALVVSLVAMFICMMELVYKGQKQKIGLRMQGRRCRIHCPSSNDNPYTFLDAFSLVTGISQIVFSSIAYSYLCRGAKNPIKVCFVPVIFIICMAYSKLVKKPNETSLTPIRRDTLVMA